mmetsp:Transcript_10870/g.19869  ORF Transcript_10870/g.19869 Transcript_10870/m.19869 type:complete len:89 (+) Transcript_10870:201-467(+)
MVFCGLDLIASAWLIDGESYFEKEHPSIEIILFQWIQFILRQFSIQGKIHHELHHSIHHSTGSQFSEASLHLVPNNQQQYKGSLTDHT